MSRNSVVLPAPFGPRRPVSPGPNEHDRSDTATFCPNHLLTRSTTMVALGAKAGDVVMLSNIRLPEGVTIPALSGAGERHDATVANAVHVKADQGTGAAAAAEAQATLAGELGEPGAVAGAKAATEGEKGGEKES